MEIKHSIQTICKIILPTEHEDWPIIEDYLNLHEIDDIEAGWHSKKLAEKVSNELATLLKTDPSDKFIFIEEGFE